MYINSLYSPFRLLLEVRDFICSSMTGLSLFLPKPAKSLSVTSTMQI